MRKLFAIVMLMAATAMAVAQTPVKVSSEVVDFNGKRCYVHVLQSGQTVHSVAQAYGNKYYEAITRKDIHLLSVGDTVWLPCKNPNQPLSAGTKVVEKQETPAQESLANYIKVEPGQTLYGISRAYNVSIEDIKSLNPEVAESGLKAGQMLRLPTKGKPSASQTSQQGGQNASQGSKNASAAPAPAAPVEVRGRVDREKIYVSVMMPLYLSQMNEISTTKFDLEQRGKKTYKSLEFIQFYEGIQIALSELQSRGVQVVLNVVDVPGNTAAEAEKAFTSHNVAHSDVVLTLLTKEPFEKVAQLARQNKVFVVNAMSTRQDIVDNPYVVKVMPSAAGQASAILKSIGAHYSGSTITVVHSGLQRGIEAALKEELASQSAQMGIKCDFVVWTNDNKLVASLKKNTSNVVVNIYDQDKSRNRIQVSTLLNRLSSIKGNPPVLYSIIDYTKEYTDVDFGQLQQLSYHTVNTDYDENDPAQHRFVETFREQYKTEPIGLYAGQGHDLMVYFVNGLQEKGSEFWKNPSVANLQSMLNPIHLRQSAPGKGYENQYAAIRRMGDYRFVSESSTTIKK